MFKTGGEKILEFHSTIDASPCAISLTSDFQSGLNIEIMIAMLITGLFLPDLASQTNFFLTKPPHQAFFYPSSIFFYAK